MSIVSEILSNRRQSVLLVGNVSASVSGMLQGGVLEPLLLILHTSELFHTVGNHIVSYADDTTINTLTTRPRP